MQPEEMKSWRRLSSLWRTTQFVEDWPHVIQNSWNVDALHQTRVGSEHLIFSCVEMVAQPIFKSVFLKGSPQMKNASRASKEVGPSRGHQSFTHSPREAVSHTP